MPGGDLTLGIHGEHIFAGLDPTLHPNGIAGANSPHPLPCAAGTPAAA